MINNYCHCPLCKSELSFYKTLTKEINILECRNCDIKRLFPQPEDNILQNIYNSDYFLHENFANKDHGEFLKNKTAINYLQEIISLTNISSGTLLEVGCGSGDFLLAAQKKGFNVYGLEISDSSIQTANKKLGSNKVIKNSFDAPLPVNKLFDIVVLFDVIEHLRNPFIFLERVYKVLVPGGMIVIATPSLDSWSAKIMGKYWMEYKLEHLWYFSNNSLKNSLSNVGFSEITIKPNYKYLSIDYIYLHFSRYKVPVVTPILKIFKSILPTAITTYPLKIVASGVFVLGKK